MSEHFIREIEIKNFKCFEDFKAEGFGRVNLIGGKNNVGKTAFMEACYLVTAIDIPNLYNDFLEINTHRDVINQLLDTKYRNDDLKELIINNKSLTILSSIGNIFITEESGILKINILDKEFKYTLSELMSLLDINILHTKLNNTMHFISQNSNVNHYLNTIIDNAKLDNKLSLLNRYLFELFNVDSIDTIKYKPFIKIGNDYSELSQFGQGIKTFINIISSMLLLEDSFIFIDEIENGIHYSHLDRVWEIILSISKEQNVQVFATTHSKECIASFNKVQQKLKDKDTYYFEMAKNVKTDKILMFQMDNEQLEYGLSHNERLRGE
jgi:AAA15 family ATPase/GTPase